MAYSKALEIRSRERQSKSIDHVPCASKDSVAHLQFSPLQIHLRLGCSLDIHSSRLISYVTYRNLKLLLHNHRKMDFVNMNIML